MSKEKKPSGALSKKSLTIARRVISLPNPNGKADGSMQYCVARASFCRPGLPGEPINPHEDEAEFLQWLGLATEFAKAVAPYQTPKLLAHAIQATVAESRGLPGTSARERFKELVLNSLAAEKLALKEIAHEPENTSIAEPAAEPVAAPDDADGVLVR